MRIRVLLFAAHRESLGRSEVTMEVPPGTTLDGVYAVLTAKESRLSQLRPYTSFALNREIVDPGTAVQEGDEVAFLQPVSGGQDVIELTDEPLSLERCVSAVRVPGTGGISAFIGTVRDISDGKRVNFLEYEAYKPMARSKLEQVVAEVRERWPVRAIAIEHRLGKLELGDDAVIIAVACPHRAEAFQACRYAIDRLKEIVPIWKKEHGEDGAVWVGGPGGEISATPAPSLD